MERPKARFQALSALSGTGFTTREAESIVDHPKRRRIVTYLQEQDITILAVERGDKILPHPQLEEKLFIGDYLLCYGKAKELIP